MIQSFQSPFSNEILFLHHLKLLNVVSDDVFKENVWWRNNISFEKGDWEDCIITSKRLDTNYWQVQDWKDISARFSISTTKHHFEGHWHTVHQQSWCSNTLKRNKLKVYDSLKESKLTYFTNSKGSSQVLELVHDFRKIYYLRQYEVHVFSPWLCMHIPKILCKQGIQKKLCTRISKFCSP